MNALYCRPLSVKLTPTLFSPGRTSPDLFNVILKYRPDAAPMEYSQVYIPKELQSAMQSGVVSGFHIETLEINSVTAQELPGAPKYVILQVSTTEGTAFEVIPESLLYARRKRLLIGGAACLLGGLLVFSPCAWAGAIALVLGSHSLRTAKRIPHYPLVVFGEHY